MTLAFYIAAAVALLSTALVITRRDPVHALLYLVVSLLAVAVDMFLLGAPFLAAMEVVIYAGAIMVVFVFALMILGAGGGARSLQTPTPRTLRTWAGPAALAAVLGAAVILLLAQGDGGGDGGEVVGAEEVGQALFGPYFIGVELASFLLLAGLFGAFHLGRRGPRSPEEEPR